MAEEKQPTTELAPPGSLAEVRNTFGALLIDSNVGVVLHQDYRDHGDRILINTTAEGIRGPKTGKASLVDKPGSAFIDLALTPEIAEKVYNDLGKALESYRETKVA